MATPNEIPTLGNAATTDIAGWRMGEFLRLLFMSLWSLPDGATTGELLDQIAHATDLSDAELSRSPVAAGFSNYEIAIRAAMTALLKAGWLAHENGRWTITEAGRLVCKDFRSADEFYTQSERFFSEWRHALPALQLVSERAQEMAGEQIRQYLLGLKPHEFRLLVGDLLQAMGYHVAWIAPAGKERGNIDLVVLPDPLGFRGPRILVQVKHKGQAVTAEGLKASLAALGPEEYGLLVSSGGFTHEARESMRGNARIRLVDLDLFCKLWVGHNDKLSQDAQRRFPLRPIHFLSVQD
jgi:restriction system protein